MAGVPSTVVQIGGAAAKGRKGVSITGEEVIKPESSGAKRAAKMWGLVMLWGLGVPACMLTAVSALLMLDFASDLAVTWGEVVKLSLIALAITVASTSLMALSGLLEDTRPHEVAAARRAWGYAIGALAAGAVFFVARSGPDVAPVDNPRATELRAELGRLASPTEWDAWNATQGCSAPTARWAPICDTIKRRRDQQWAEVQRIESGQSEWSPARVLGTGYLAGLSEHVRRLVVFMLSLAALVAAGHLARWGALGYQDSQRPAAGAAAPVPVAGAASMSRGGPALTSPIAMADMWFNGRVSEDADGILNPTAAYEDYVLACQENAAPPMPIGQFYNWLTAKAKAAGEKVGKGKSRGVMVYRGWVLGEQDVGLLDEESYDALPYHA